jgi:hypothetical protein
MRRTDMKAGVVFTGTGPIVVLTRFETLEDERLIKRLREKGIDKFIVHEIPLELVEAKYGRHLKVVLDDLEQTDELRVLDIDGQRVFHNFSFEELCSARWHETAQSLPGDSGGVLT